MARPGELLATADHATTIDTDVLDGIDACRADLAGRHPAATYAEVLACSSAGGGLRIAVVGNEELVTAEAGRRVALSSGGKVVAVLSGGLDARQASRSCGSARPDVLLLVGGTDGGNSEGLVADGEFLSRVPWQGPVVVAGDVEAQGSVSAALEISQTPYVLADNVVPKIGVLAPGSARSAIREMFLEHVIGGKRRSRLARLRPPRAARRLAPVRLRRGGMGRPLHRTRRAHVGRTRRRAAHLRRHPAARASPISRSVPRGPPSPSKAGADRRPRFTSATTHRGSSSSRRRSPRPCRAPRTRSPRGPVPLADFVQRRAARNYTLALDVVSSRRAGELRRDGRPRHGRQRGARDRARAASAEAR